MIKAGQKLKEERIKRNLSFEDVSSATKIRVEFLEAIEKGEYNKLPSASYAHGFVRNYAKFLDLPEEKTLALFRREFDEKKNFEVLPEGLVGSSDFPVHRFKIRLPVILAIFLFVLFVGYIGFQYRYAILNPPLSVGSPQEASEISSQTLIVSGKTDPASNIFINDEQVSVGTDGTFKKELNVFPGRIVIKIEAINRFGRKTTIERHVVIK